MIYDVCQCIWCRTGDKQPKTEAGIMLLANQLLGSSGPFLDSDPVHQLALAVKQLLFARRGREELHARITQYLSVGGFFNPEMMDHEKVRDLLIDCRTALAAHGGTPQDDELEDARNDIAGMRDVLKQIMDALELRGAHEISAVVGHIQKLKAAHGGTAPHPERTDAMTQREEAERGYANLKQDHRQIAHYVVERCGDFILDLGREDFIAEFLRAAWEAGQVSASQEK